jgi:hypothetical protein
MEDDRDGDGFDAVRWWVGPCVSPEEAKKTEVDAAEVVEAGVRGPHSGEALAHSTEGVLHCARPDRVVAGRNAAISIPLGKDLEEEDRVVNIGKGGISADGMAEVGPDGPGAVLGAGARRNDTGVECCPEQTEVSADCIVL